MQFKLTDQYQPRGDQVKAIPALAEGLRNGDQYQTLLGVTGSGKSLPPDEPIWIYREEDGVLSPVLTPIGAFVDEVLGHHQSLTVAEGTEVALFDLKSPRYHTVSVNPLTLEAQVRPLTAVHRHRAPERLWTVTTTCGRSVRVTGDHNLWVLREGRLQLLETHEVRAGDYLPLPTSLPPVNQALKKVSTAGGIDERRVFLHCQEQLRALRGSELKRLSALIRPAAPQLGYKRLQGVAAYNERLSLADARLLASHGVDLDLDEARVGVQHGGREMPLTLTLTDALLELLGFYVAEGHAEDGYFLISCDERECQQRLEQCLADLGLTWNVRQNGYDYSIPWTLYAQLFGGWCGRRSREKRLPEFWARLSQSQLGLLLAAYFTGDGGVEHDEVTVTTASRELASQLSYALARFGLWPRIAKRFKRATNSCHAGDWYYRLSVSGVDQLRAFASEINFHTERKRRQLAALLEKRSNTNVDLVPVSGSDVHHLRTEVGWTQAELASRIGCTRPLISLIESGQRRPSRALFARLVETLAAAASAGGLSHLDPEIERLSSLLASRWAPVRNIVEEESGCEWVYDLSVAENETFLAGFGGLFVHNTFSMAGIIQDVQRPALVIAHNKTLAAQLCSEFREFFPENAVEYFVSYYDYYQPEAYIPQSDTYIEKDSAVNDEIDRLRHSATQALLERRDVIIVASVSCIYGLGSPEEYQKNNLTLQVGKEYYRRELLRQLVDMQFSRNDTAPVRGTFRVKGDLLEICPADEEIIIRVDFFGDEIEKIEALDPTTGELIRRLDKFVVFPASHFVTSEDRLEVAMKGIEKELEERLEYFRNRGSLLEAQRLEQRTLYDLEMMREVGYCNGIENYSRHMDGRLPGSPPHTLLDYFPRDFVLFIDESHVTIPQIHGMYGGDQTRKRTLVEYGFRLPSAMDNRPLKWEEFKERIGQAVFVSATPGPYEREVSTRLVEQIIRPTGLVDPEVEVRPTRGQIDDLVSEARKRIESGERVLVTTLTKKMAEDLSEYLANINIKVHYLHSDVKTLDRLEIIRDLRLGVYDVIVGINLLREGLDIPEVSLVAIMDADKEGFLRSETSLIQTIGRAARNVSGKVLLYADAVTPSMERAIKETSRRRELQVKHNEEHGIRPETIRKAIREIIQADRVAEPKAAYGVSPDAVDETMPAEDLLQAIQALEAEMKSLAKKLEFEQAAHLRDEINRLKRLMPDAQFAETVAPSRPTYMAKRAERAGGNGRRKK